MKSLILAGLASLFSISVSAAGKHRVHLPLEVSSEEYTALLNKQKRSARFDALQTAEDVAIERWLKVGQRNLQWVTLVNSVRPPETKISLSSPATMGGFPVSSPSSYNFKIIKDKCDIIESLLPKVLKDVVYGGAQLTEQVPVTDREFSEWLMQVDRCYQSVARYKLILPWKDELIEEAKTDVRGYLRMINDPQYDQKLNQWTSQGQLVKNQILMDLSQICWNSGAEKSACEKELTAATSGSALLKFKAKYILAAKKHYEGYFKIPQYRKDITWNSSNPALATIPITDPNNAAVYDYLKYNIEDEWQWNGWQLKLNFVNISSPNITHVEFVPGSTPHVNGLAGSKITMDANAPLTEYDVQWTIRHEYGHVLGFPDCYLEFYDESVEAFVNYQLDVTDLMCSRRGSLKQNHFDEMKRAYYKN